MLFLGLPGPVANGTNRISIIAQNIVAVRTFFRRGFSDFVSVSASPPAAIPGAVLGALVGVRLDGEWFDRILAIVMLGVLVLMQLPSKKRSGGSEPMTRGRLIAGHLLMFGAGCWGGFIQVGVGFILMPILHRVMGLDLVRTNMHKVFIALSYNLVAVAIFASVSKYSLAVRHRPGRGQRRRRLYRRALFRAGRRGLDPSRVHACAADLYC
jgi:uncharacterized membrane protein YfcA